MGTSSNGLGDVATSLSDLEAKATEMNALSMSGEDDVVSVSSDSEGDSGGQNEPSGATEGQDEPDVVSVSSDDSEPNTADSSTETASDADEGKTDADFLNYEPDGYEVRGEKHDYDDWAKDLMIDAETESKFRDLYTRGHGLEVVKKERDEIRAEHAKVQGVLEKAESAYERGDMDQVMNLIGIEPKAVEDWVKKRQTVNELPEEQRKIYEQNQARERHYLQLEEQNKSFMKQRQDAEVNRLGSDVEELLSGEGAPFAREYDERVGREGAFKKIVFDQGSQIYQNEKRVASVAEATQAAIDLLGLSGAVESEGDISDNVVPIGEAPKAKPVIPNIGASSGVSPVARRVSSLDDLVKIRESMTV